MHRWNIRKNSFIRSFHPPISKLKSSFVRLSQFHEPNKCWAVFGSQWRESVHLNQCECGNLISSGRKKTQKILIWFRKRISIANQKQIILLFLTFRLILVLSVVAHGHTNAYRPNNGNQNINSHFWLKNSFFFLSFSLSKMFACKRCLLARWCFRITPNNSCEQIFTTSIWQMQKC